MVVFPGLLAFLEEFGNKQSYCPITSVFLIYKKSQFPHPSPTHHSVIFYFVVGG